MPLRSNVKRFILATSALPSSHAALAQDWNCDVDDYITKSIGIEEPWVENAGYLFTQINKGSPSSLTVAPEIEARLNERFGMEIDLPAYTTALPLGHGQSALSPFGAGIKAGVIHDCNVDRGQATLLTFELEGQYWADRRPDVLPDEGNSITAQAMWAQLWYPFFNEGEIGYTQHVGSGVTSGWFVNTSFGKSLGNPNYSVQLEAEADNQLVLDNGQRGIEGYFMPQIAYHATPWLFAVGEQANIQQGNWRANWSTWLMVEREF